MYSEEIGDDQMDEFMAMVMVLATLIFITMVVMLEKTVPTSVKVILTVVYVLMIGGMIGNDFFGMYEMIAMATMFITLAVCLNTRRDLFQRLTVALLAFSIGVFMFYLSYIERGGL